MPGGQDDESAKPIPHNDLTEFVSSDEGLALNKAFERIRDAKVRKRVVSLVQSLAAWVSEREN